ncbi:MAG: diadenylate cyclase [Kiritimatiellae bacterium]|nr:diadenylate cyclase [Kiritimatiellia bacterium]
MGYVSAILQIFIIYLAIYAILKGARGSRFGQALMGVGILTTILALSTYLFNFYVLAFIIKYILFYLAFSTVIIFQPEIRRMLSAVGALGNFDKVRSRSDGKLTPESFTETLIMLSAARMGALFAFERGISLRGYEETGVKTDAAFSSELVTSIFTPPLPLHDGGVVLRGGRISSAHCIFPVSNNPDLIRSGMRHRAAVGLSEETDALVVVVSEERGTISIAHNGRLYRYDGPSDQIKAPVTRWVRKAISNGKDDRSFLQTASGWMAKILPKPQKNGADL